MTGTQHQTNRRQNGRHRLWGFSAARFRTSVTPLLLDLKGDREAEKIDSHPNPSPQTHTSTGTYMVDTSNICRY